MRLKEYIILIGTILLFPIAVFSSLFLKDKLEQKSFATRPEKVNIKTIYEKNRIPGKKAALDMARVYVDQNEYGSVYTRKKIADELRAFGYSEEEIQYAIENIAVKRP